MALGSPYCVRCDPPSRASVRKLRWMPSWSSQASGSQPQPAFSPSDWLEKMPRMSQMASTARSSTHLRSSEVAGIGRLAT